MAYNHRGLIFYGFSAELDRALADLDLANRLNPMLGSSTSIVADARRQVRVGAGPYSIAAPHCHVAAPYGCLWQFEPVRPH